VATLASDSRLYVTLSSGRDVPVTCGVSPAVCHCGRPSLVVVVMGAVRIVQERAVAMCAKHAVDAARYSVRIGRPVSFFTMAGEDITAGWLGTTAAHLVGVR
jgi:hypothetical protein